MSWFRSRQKAKAQEQEIRRAGESPEAVPEPAPVSAPTPTEAPVLTARVFIDYEHWVYGIKNLFGLEPDPLSWRNELAETYELTQISVFGNFGDPMMADHLPQIRQITNHIYETRTDASQAPKDMTDFIMLDNIYQSVDESNGADTYILFTGDGHFQSVARYLKQRKGKKVIIYGIKGAISRALQAIADECHEIPLDGQILQTYVTHILENLHHFDQNRHEEQYATFLKTAEVVARFYEVDEMLVRAALSWLIDQEYIKRIIVNPRADLEVRALKVDWEKVEAEKLWKQPGL